MALQRANPYLGEIIEVLDLHLEKYQGDQAKARERLSAADNEWIDQEILHCMTDTRYFLSNFYAIKTEDEGYKGLYPFWDSQEILYESLMEQKRRSGRVKKIVNKARQMGGSTFVSGYVFAETIFSEHINTIVVAQDADVTRYLLDMYQAALDYLPWWLRPRLRYYEAGKFMDFDEKDNDLRQSRPGLKTRIYGDNGNKPTGAGRSKCQTPWTYVWTSEGPITLEGLFDKVCDPKHSFIDDDGIGEWFVPTEDVFTWAFDGENVVRRRITKIYRKEHKGKIQKIVSANGAVIEKTERHGVLSRREWATDLSIDDVVDRIEVLPWNGTEEPCPNFVELLAWQISEGCETVSSLYITQKDNTVRARIADLVESVTGVKPMNRDVSEREKSPRAGYVVFASKEYRKRLLDMGYVWGKRSAEKTIPSFVFRWSKDRIALFLRTLFEAEGSAGDRVTFSTASRQLMESVRLLCSIFGISVRTLESRQCATNTIKKTKRTYYKAQIGGKSLRLFEEHIGFISSRKIDLLRKYSERTTNCNVEVYHHLTQMFRDACRESGTPYKKIVGCSKRAHKQNFSKESAREALERMKEVCENLPTQYIPNCDHKVVHQFYRKCNQEVLKRWAEKIERELASPLIEEGLKSVSVYEYDGLVYDLEVEDVHNYPTGGIITHNTFNRGHLDEIGWWNDASQLTKSLFATMNALDGIYIMISTPTGRNNAWHNLWKKAEAGKIDWEPVYIPFYRREKTYSLPIPKGEKFILSEDEEMIRQNVMKKESYLVKDEVFNWRRKKIEEFIATDGDDKMFNQEYSSSSEESFQTSAVTAYPRGIINKLSKRTRNPLWMGEIHYDFETGRPKTKMRNVTEIEDLVYPEHENRYHVWEMPQAGASYCVGVDVSLGNDGGDYSCCQVIKTSELMQDQQVACWHGYIDPESLSEIVLAICWMYNEAMAAVEVNSMGMVTNNKLVRQYEYENIYRYKHLDKLTHWMTDIIGFWTNDKTKRALMSKMSKTLLEESLDIPCKFTVDEFYDFTEDGAEGDGAHDDFVMSLMIALYCAHENEYREMREGTSKPESKTAQNEFKVLDRFGTIIQTTNSQQEAQKVSKKNIGSSIVRTSGATATVPLGGKQRKVPSDFQNSEWSPVHDGTGTASKLFDEGYDAEEITSELIQQYEADQEGLDSDDENSWLFQ